MTEFIAQVLAWLKDGGEVEAHGVFKQCTVEVLDVDGGLDAELYRLGIRAPRKVYENINGVYDSVRDQIREAIATCLYPKGFILDLTWLPRLPDVSRTPAEDSVASIMEAVDLPHVREAWRKVSERRTSDPDGAITAAKSLLETVLKHILDHRGISYERSADLPHLYRLVSETLNLAPSQTSIRALKSVLGGCQSVVSGLANMRNELGDAHGQGVVWAKPSETHAELAANLAGAMAVFLVETWEASKRPLS